LTLFREALPADKSHEMEQTAARWRPIGAVLVEGGAISQAQLDAALAEQQQTGKRLGEVLIDSGAITWLALAHAIAEQARDLEEEPSAPSPAEEEPVAVLAAVPVAAPVPVATPAPVVVTEPVPVTAPIPTVAPVPVHVLNGGDAESRLETVETMLKERQRAFLELVSTTESLRRTVGRLKDEVLARDAEIAKLRSQIHA
jgi:hypothetical protein